MKHALLVIIFAAITVLCFGTFQFDLGFDAAGTQTVKSGDLSHDYDIAFSVSPAIEYLRHYESFMYGLGAEYQVQRAVNFPGDNDGKMGFIPLYLVGRYQFSSLFHVSPEIVAQAGYNFFNGDNTYVGNNAKLSGGLYWGAGAGITIDKKYLIQLMYKSNSGTWKPDIGHDADITDTQINFGLGYRM